MANQRWSERDGDGARRGGRRRCLALARVLILAAALGALGCDQPEPTAPEIIATPDFPSGSTGGGSGEADDATLQGEWERFDVFETEFDIVTTRTHWRFSADGTCRRTITTFSVAEGFPRTTSRDCTWSTGVLEVTITFFGAAPATFDLAFAGFDPDRLILDGFEYRRIG